MTMGVAMGICGLQLFWNITGNLEVRFGSIIFTPFAYSILARDVLFHLEQAEKARLWSVATMNCLDFDAWTTVVEETDKNAELKLCMLQDYLCSDCHHVATLRSPLDHGTPIL
ncbi:hypothetical protein ZEAMMB73_Zm00001d012608 [Zea mays]|uniref:Uncharacterized protein n=1 Tax=Zea mays TaxID=4577 RepID=A0A1D6GA08_MAIZE|nr:hypothetical protein ZEAMMB73_Zm00001d012608 [Zea mays]